jgi:hypothetical protein
VYGPELTLEQDISMVQAKEPQYGTAVVERGTLARERTNAKTVLQPTEKAIYTQPNGVAARRIGQVSAGPYRFLPRTTPSVGMPAKA